MKDFAGIANTTGSFPSVTGQDISAPGDGTGTPFVAQWLNDLWGFAQALLNYSGQTPDAATETGTSSQLLDAIKLLGAYPGVVLPLHIDGDPAGLSPAPRLLLLQGQGIVRANYTELDAACYVGDANNATAPAYYHATDAAGTSRSTSGAYLILPDMRGYTARGLDTAAAVDPDGASRSLGDTQADTFDGHIHSVGVNNEVTISGGSYDGYYLRQGTISFQAGTTNYLSVYASIAPVDNVIDNVDSITGSAGSAETRMKNVSVNWAIVY